MLMSFGLCVCSWLILALLLMVLMYLSFHCRLQFVFDVGFLAIFGRLDDSYREKLKENYHIVDAGYNSFPTNIPGTAYQKALLVSYLSSILVCM